jgi:hypothetical protein
MPSAKEYANRVQKIVRGEGSIFGRRSKTKLKWETIPEAKQLQTSIRQMQIELRQVKKEVSAEMKAIRARYATASAKVRPSGLSVFGGKGAKRSNVASQKQELREKRDRELSPYESLKLAIDSALTQLDGAKLEIQIWIDEQQ